MSTPVTPGTDPKKTVTTRWQQIIGIIAILILTWVLFPSTPKVPDNQNGVEPPVVHPLPPQPRSDTIEIVKRDWHGVTCTDDRMRIDGKILTTNVWWEVRLDKDDGRIYPLYPKNYSPGKHLEITNDFNVMEWRIKSDQTNDYAIVAWSISLKR